MKFGKNWLFAALLVQSLLLLVSCPLENNAADEYVPGIFLAAKHAGVDILAAKIIACCQQGSGYYEAAKNASDGDRRSEWNSAYSGNSKYGHQDQEALGGDGNHWITLDLGEHKDGIFRLKYQGVYGWYNGSIRRFEVYVSDDLSKLGHIPDPSAKAAVRTDTWSFTEWYGRNDPDDAVRYAEFQKVSGEYPSGRYVQLRALEAEATDDPQHQGDNSQPPWKLMSAAEMSVDFLGDFTESDKRELNAVYGRGLALLQTVDKSSVRVQVLIKALDTAKELLATPEPDLLTAALAFQGEIDRCTASIITAIYAVKTPPKPPEY